ncbi:MAG: VacJ family lipoprotein, partial [Azoarcus sp.]|nr:VacJ family lipoprotein [Azoarcus sp.]
MNATMRPLRSSTRVLVLTAAVLLGTGCATTASNPQDPLEGYNRAMFSFNEGLDKAVIKPAAQVYEAVLPSPVRTGVGNVFGNLGDPWIGINNLLQGKVADALSDMMRFVFNSTFGIAGLFDIASEMGFAKHDEDFGQTLGRWGVGDGAYIVLPFFGSRTLRDAAMLP